MNAIEIKNLHFSYGKENVLDGVSLCLKEGRLAILAGENGAGKSTLLRLLLGELPIGESHKGDQEEGSSDGSIEILGQDIRQFKDWSSISYVPQNGMGGWKDFPASVEEIVRANLYKQIGLFRFAGKKRAAAGKGCAGAGGHGGIPEPFNRQTFWRAAAESAPGTRPGQRAEASDSG